MVKAGVIDPTKVTRSAYKMRLVLPECSLLKQLLPISQERRTMPPMGGGMGGMGGGMY